MEFTENREYYIVLENRGESSRSSDPTLAEEVGQSEKFRWTHEATMLLIELRLTKEKDFTRPICRKKKLWENISSSMLEIGGYKVSGDVCDSKYRNLRYSVGNLLGTYKTNKRRSQQSGEGSVTWEYYQKFDQVLANKACILPPNENLGTLDTIDGSFSSDASETPQELEIEVDPASVSAPPKKKKRELSLREYLFLKHEREEQRRAEKRELELKKLELKEKEIEAMKELAAAIAGKK